MIGFGTTTIYKYILGQDYDTTPGQGSQLPEPNFYSLITNFSTGLQILQGLPNYYDLQIYTKPKGGPCVAEITPCRNTITGLLSLAINITSITYYYHDF
jgi:hypothetical protein